MNFWAVKLLIGGGIFHGLVSELLKGFKNFFALVWGHSPDKRKDVALPTFRAVADWSFVKVGHVVVLATKESDALGLVQLGEDLLRFYS